MPKYEVENPGKCFIKQFNASCNSELYHLTNFGKRLSNSTQIWRLFIVWSFQWHLKQGLGLLGGGAIFSTILIYLEIRCVSMALVKLFLELLHHKNTNLNNCLLLYSINSVIYFWEYSSRQIMVTFPILFHIRLSNIACKYPLTWCSECLPTLSKKYNVITKYTWHVQFLMIIVCYLFLVEQVQMLRENVERWTDWQLQQNKKGAGKAALTHR